MNSEPMTKNIRRPVEGLVLSLAFISGCASADGKEIARGLLEGVVEASSIMAATRGGKYAQYAPIAQAASQMFEPVQDLPPFQEEPEVHLGEMPGTITAASGDAFPGGRYQSSGNWDVQGIVKRLAAASGLPEYPVSVVADNSENAFAHGNRIVVTQGLLRAAASEDELALVLGHEIAHNVLGHPQSRPEHHDLVDIIDGVVSKSRGFGNNTKLAIGGLAGAVKGVHTRPQEREADNLGTEIAFKAGYDPIRGTSFFQRSMARNDSAMQRIASLRSEIAAWERYLDNASNARAREQSYQARAHSWMEQARINRDRAAAIHRRDRTQQTYHQAINFEKRYRLQFNVYQQALYRHRRASQNEAAAQANFKAARQNFDLAVKHHHLGMIPFVQTHPMNSERIQNVVALTQQLRSGDARVASVSPGGWNAGASSPSPGGMTAIRRGAGQVASLQPASTGSTHPDGEAVAVAVAEGPVGQEAGLPSVVEAEARPEQEAVPVLARSGSGSRQARAVVEEAVSPGPALSKKVFIRGLRTSQELSFGETGNLNVWAISGAVVNPTGQPMKQARLRAIFYDEAGEEVHKEEKSVSFSPGVAEAPLTWNVKGVALRAQRVEVMVVGTDKMEHEKPKTAKKAKRSA